MIEEIFEVEKIKEDLKTDLVINVSKLDGVHFQSPSLVGIKDLEAREEIFQKLTILFKSNKFIKSYELNTSGFINFNLNVYEVLNFLQQNKEEFIRTIVDEEPRKYLFDYGGPNIGKSMHVGHLRPLNIGRALYNMYTISKNECISDIHLGDWGIPISQILTFCYENRIDVSDIAIEDLKKIYPEASKLSSLDTNFKNKVDRNLHKLNTKDEGVYKDWKTISDITVNDVKTILSKMNHDFDLFYGESSVIDIIPEMIQTLKDKNLIKEDAGALISSEKFEPPILVLKSDGTYLYMTTDLATVLDRENSISPDYYFYIVDSRQSEHFKQLFSSVKFFNFSNSEFEHIGFGTINDLEGKPFKTRDGETYPLEKLWQEIYSILEKKNNEINAGILTNSVLVFSDLVVDRKSNYKFDINQFTNIEGKTAIYLQYTRVRIKSILDSQEFVKYSTNTSEEDFVDSETSLLISILKFSDIFNRSKKLKEPHHLAEYLYEVCQKFNSFYKDVKIINPNNESLQNRRMNVLLSTLNIIELIFEILGIKAVDKM